MAIRSTHENELTSLILPKGDRLIPPSVDHDPEKLPVVNLQEAINNAAEEMADILSTFGRFSKAGRKNDSSEYDVTSWILEEQVNEKLDLLVRQVAKLSHSTDFLAFARSLFPNESDLLLALRAIVSNYHLSILQKKKLEKALADVEKFGDCKKIQSGINVARLAKRFTEGDEERPLSANALRDGYLLFLELAVPAGFIYQHWIENYGCHQRKRLLAFTLSALVTDIKAYEPGIHYIEFGPLSAKLCDARLLHTLDQSLLDEFSTFPFYQSLNHGSKGQEEENIIKLYLTGLNDVGNFPKSLQHYVQHSMASLLITQQITVIQSIYNIYMITPTFLFTDSNDQETVLGEISSLLFSLYKKDKHQFYNVKI